MIEPHDIATHWTIVDFLTMLWNLGLMSNKEYRQYHCDTDDVHRLSKLVKKNKGIICLLL